MGSSSKKKNEKKKDFQKAKLKVGKTKPKASNVTNTSFAAKSIVLKQQSLHTDAPTLAALIDHHLALVSSRQESQRRESLAALANDLTHRDGGQRQERSVAAVTIIHKVRPCLIDGSRSIREQALRVLRALAPTEIAYNTPAILIYVHIGMVHLVADIRLSSLDVLEWLLQVAPHETVSCAGGWIKTISTFASLLKWQSAKGEDANGWSTKSTAGTSSRGPTDGKLKARQISVLAALLNVGMGLTPTAQGHLESPAAAAHSMFPIWHQSHHRIGSRPDPYASLGLFGTVTDASNVMYDDAASRSEAFERSGLYDCMNVGLADVRKEGGEIGRAASLLAKALGAVTRPLTSAEKG